MECYPIVGSHTFSWRTMYSSPLFSLSLDSSSKVLFVVTCSCVCARESWAESWRVIYRWQWHSSDFQPRPSALEIIYFVPEIMLYNSRTLHTESYVHYTVWAAGCSTHTHTHAYSFAFAVIASHQVLCSCCYCSYQCVCICNSEWMNALVYRLLRCTCAVCTSVCTNSHTHTIAHTIRAIFFSIYFAFLFFFFYVLLLVFLSFANFIAHCVVLFSLLCFYYLQKEQKKKEKQSCVLHNMTWRTKCRDKARHGWYSDASSTIR